MRVSPTVLKRAVGVLLAICWTGTAPAGAPPTSLSDAQPVDAQAVDAQAVDAPVNAHGSDAQVILARRGWHIDIGFATDTLKGPLAALARGFPGARYLFLGFGDLRYLLSKHRHGPVLLEALWPGRALILLTAIQGTPEEAFGAAHVIRLHLHAEQAAALEGFLLNAFEQGATLPPAPYAPGPYEGSAYYRAAARYSALHTCNTWVAEALQAAGLSIHPRGVLFAGQLWRRVQRIAITQRTGGVPASFNRWPVRCSSGRAAESRPDTPRSSDRSAARRRLFSAARAGSSC